MGGLWLIISILGLKNDSFGSGFCYCKIGILRFEGAKKFIANGLVKQYIFIMINFYFMDG
jgi:hypothetical protein